MQWIIHIMEVVLLGLIGFLIYSLIKNIKADKHQGILEVRVAPKAPYRPEGERYANHSESIKQLQLFWGTQTLEMRLEGFNPELLSHPSLRSSLLDYLQGASNAVADHFECNQEQRLHLQSYLMSKGLRFAHLDVTTEWLQRLDQLLACENTDIYNAGYEAASLWVAHRTPPKERSLLKSITSWGLVA
ncbi:hypothetical protein [Hahella ganghwensis]|uniref:hypothetical protein n=1 Tax=Hahella ganghwensis TaxID=286420 RepID=UPI00035CB131|nr:hypothetical protein [Hahella ganghwensis]